METNIEFLINLIATVLFFGLAIFCMYGIYRSFVFFKKAKKLEAAFFQKYIDDKGFLNNPSTQFWSLMLDKKYTEFQSIPLRLEGASISKLLKIQLVCVIIFTVLLLIAIKLNMKMI